MLSSFSQSQSIHLLARPVYFASFSTGLLGSQLTLLDCTDSLDTTAVTAVLPPVTQFTAVHHGLHVARAAAHIIYA
jgi:hypothetical protein